MCHFSAGDKVQIYLVAVLLGAGGSTMLVTALSTVADLIGRNTESGAFVYGFMSFTDKVSNGVAVVLIQHCIPSHIDTCNPCRFYFRDILFYVCGGAALLGALSMAALVPFNLGERWRDRPILTRNVEEADETTPLVS